MNKRIWSIAIALAMLLSMVCSAFVVSAAETQAAVQIEEEQNVTEEIEISQQAPLLAAEAGTLPYLKLSLDSDIAVGSQFAVGLSLENYSNDWATFTADLNYDTAAVQYLGYDATKLPEGVFASVDEYTVGTLTIVILSSTGANISVSELLDLNFRATAVPAQGFSAAILEGTVARYTDANGATEIVDASAYTAAATVDSYTITKKTPYLTICLVDAEGNEISGGNIEQGKELYAIVTLKDYYDPWSAMTLSLNYDSSLFTYVETEGEDLDAFVSDANGRMTVIPAETEDPEKPLSICFMSSDLSNRPLKDGKSSEDVLKLKFVASSVFDNDKSASIGTSFVEDGNLKTDETGGVTVLTPTEDFKTEDEENGTAPITIESIQRPNLTLEVVDSNGDSLDVDLNNMKVEKGDSFTVRVKINNFEQKWSMMSLFAQFDEDVFEIGTVKKGVFGDYMVPVLMSNTLGVTLLNTSGADTGLSGDATEGIILEIPLTVKADATFSGGIDPFQVFFDTEGNYSGGEKVSPDYYNSKQGDPAEIIMKAQGQPQVKMTHAAVGEANLDNLVAGDQVQFTVSVDNFISKWSAMTLQVKFNSDVFELVDGSVTDLKPFDTTADPNGGYSTFLPSAGGGYLLACWFNGVDLPMKNGESQEVMTFTLQVKDGYTVAANDLTQTISVKFDEKGNYAEGNLLTGTETVGGDGAFITTAAKVEVTVVEPEAPEIMVVIAWGAMEFTYNFGTWEPNAHIWDGQGWTCASDDDKTITVTNQGQVDITASFAFNAETAMGALTGTFKKDGTEVESLLEVTAGNAESVLFDLGELPEGVTLSEGKTTLGTITVTINKKADS